MKFIHRQAYQSDLKDQEWKWFKKFLPQPSAVGSRGRPQEWPMREIVNAMLYLLRTGCQWRMLPHDLPPWQTVYYHYRKWRLPGVLEILNRLLPQQVRQDAGREPTPSAAIVDAQSVKTTLVKGKRISNSGMTMSRIDFCVQGAASNKLGKTELKTATCNPIQWPFSKKICLSEPDASLDPQAVR